MVKDKENEMGYISGGALLVGLGIGAGITYLIYKMTRTTTWKLGDVLSVPSEGGALTYTVTGVDTTQQVYGLSLGIWPNVGVTQYFTFSDLRALNPVKIDHVEIP